jgi:hypothetical protein
MKMLGLTNHEGNVNKNHNDISAHSCKSRSYTTRGAAEEEECKLVKPLWKVMGFLYKIKKTTTI